jgi:hypothetical protein
MSKSCFSSRHDLRRDDLTDICKPFKTRLSKSLGLVFTRMRMKETVIGGPSREEYHVGITAREYTGNCQRWRDAECLRSGYHSTGRMRQ